MLSEKSRSQIDQGLSPIIGEEAIGEMLTHYPATEGNEPVTHDQLRAELLQLRVEMHQGFNRLLIGIPASTAAICAVVAFVARIGT